MFKNEALFGSHCGPCRPDARFGREDGPACASSTHPAMDERPGSALAAGMTRRRFLATAVAGFGMVVAACATGCSGLPGEAGPRLRRFRTANEARIVSQSSWAETSWRIVAFG